MNKKSVPGNEFLLERKKKAIMRNSVNAALQIFYPRIQKESTVWKVESRCMG